MAFDLFVAGTSLATPAAPLIRQYTDGTWGAVDLEMEFGATDADLKVEADSDPGVDHITFEVYSSGTGQPTTSIKLALTQGGLDSAVAGANLDLGVTEVLSGTSNKVSIWARFEAGVLVADDPYTNLSIRSCPLFESAV